MRPTPTETPVGWPPLPTPPAVRPRTRRRSLRLSLRRVCRPTVVEDRLLNVLPNPPESPRRRRRSRHQQLLRLQHLLATSSRPRLLQWRMCQEGNRRRGTAIPLRRQGPQEVSSIQAPGACRRPLRPRRLMAADHRDRRAGEATITRQGRREIVKISSTSRPEVHTTAELLV